MSTKELELTIDGAGKIYRAADGKHLATISATGEVNYENSAYTRGQYKEKIDALAAEVGKVGIDKKAAETKGSADFEEDNEPLIPDEEVRDVDPRISSEPPEKDPELGVFSAAWINWDHANLSEKEFAAKYKTPERQLQFIQRRPAFFADVEGLEKRLAKLTK